MKAVAKTFDEIRSDACNDILITLTVLGTPAVLGSLLRIVHQGWKPIMGVHIALLLGLVGTTLWRHRLRLVVRASVVTAAPYIVALAGLLTYGRGTGVLVFFVTACVLAGCFFSRRAALGVVVLCLTTLLAIFTATEFGAVVIQSTALSFDTTIVSRMTFLAGFAAATVAPVIAVSALLKSLDVERQRADVAVRARSDFLANMSHEMRTPMAGIMGMAEVLDHTRLDERQRTMIGNLMRAGRSLLAVLNDLLDFSKFESGHIPLEKSAFRVSDVIQNACDVFEARAEQKGLRLRVDMPTLLADIVLGDSFRLNQVVSNLIDNAVKFTERGTVTINAHLASGAGDKLILNCAVIDTGIGISADKITSIFDPFIQADMSISRTHGGSGLGLAICRHLIEAMGGTIAVSSVPGSGSSFSIRVPFELPREVTFTPAGTQPASRMNMRVHSNHPPLRLLVVDDDADMRTLAEIMLPRFGHRVILVSDGVAAVRAARADNYDCIIMDMHMPGMNGLEAMHAIKQDAGGRRIPIIALTADVVSEHVRVFMEAGADVVVAKPVDWDVLEMKLRQLTKQPTPAV